MSFSYYGFSDKPFEISPDLKFLYLSPGYRNALEAILRGFLEHKGLIVLTGEVGTGKTMLVYGILEKLPPEIKTAFIFHSTHNFKELLQQVFWELELPGPLGGVIELKDEFLKTLKKMNRRGEMLVLFLDEAQKFTEEMLGGLFFLLEAEPWVSDTLQIVLVGQPELEENFQSAFLRYHPRTKPLKIMIYPLSREESLGYIEHRLKIVGSSPVNIFSPQALSLIVDLSAGIPRVINILCDNTLFAGYQASVKKIGADLVKAVHQNLEGPTYETETFKKASEPRPHRRISFRLFFRDAVIVIIGIILVVGICWYRPELTRPLKRLYRFYGTKVDKIMPNSSFTKPLSPTKSIKNSVQFPLEKSEPSQAMDKRIPAPSTQNPETGSSSLYRIQVQKGDYLSKLVLNRYGKLNESLLDLVLIHNPFIKDIDLVQIRQQIQFPELREENLLVQDSEGTYSIHLGTFLNPRGAEIFKKMPNLKGKKISVTSKKVSATQIWYRIEAGPYERKPEALEVLKRLKSKNLLPFF